MSNYFTTFIKYLVKYGQMQNTDIKKGITQP